VPKIAWALRACSSGPVSGRSAGGRSDGGGMGGGGTVLVPACMGFRGAFRASSAYSFIGLYFGVGRVLLKAERERAWVEGVACGGWGGGGLGSFERKEGERRAL
jgi:hypothetical protein